MDKVKEVLKIYHQNDVRQKAEQKQQEYYKKALQAVSSLSINDNHKEKLNLFADSLMKRTY